MKTKQLINSAIAVFAAVCLVWAIGCLHDALLPAASAQGPGYGPAAPPVTSVAGKTGVVTLDMGDVGLGNYSATGFDGDWTTTGIVIQQAASAPLFVIPNMADTQEWTDFELKGYDADGRVYYYHSPDPEKAVVTTQQFDLLPKVWFTSTGETNRTRWVEQGATESIYEMLADNVNDEVGGWVIVVRGLDMTAQEIARIEWTYTLMSGLNREEDGLSRSVWRPIVPVQLVEQGWAPGL